MYHTPILWLLGHTGGRLFIWPEEGREEEKKEKRKEEERKEKGGGKFKRSIAIRSSK